MVGNGKLNIQPIWIYDTNYTYENIYIRLQYFVINSSVGLCGDFVRQSVSKDLQSVGRSFIRKNKKMRAVRSRILSKLIFASCVGYFDRAYDGFLGEQNLTKSDKIWQNLTKIWQNLTAVELRGYIYTRYRLFIYCILLGSRKHFLAGSRYGHGRRPNR